LGLRLLRFPGLLRLLPSLLRFRLRLSNGLWFRFRLWLRHSRQRWRRRRRRRRRRWWWWWHSLSATRQLLLHKLILAILRTQHHLEYRLLTSLHLPTQPCIGCFWLRVLFTKYGVLGLLAGVHGLELCSISERSKPRLVVARTGHIGEQVDKWCLAIDGDGETLVGIVLRRRVDGVSEVSGSDGLASQAALGDGGGNTSDDVEESGE
jgi:anti-sigma factor RsiW